MAKFNDLLDELRRWDTNRLCAERERVLREQRQLETREPALTFVAAAPARRYEVVHLQTESWPAAGPATPAVSSEDC